MKICLVNLDFVRGRSSGLAVYGDTLAKGLAALGHEVTVIASRRAGMPLHEEIGGIPVYRVGMGRANWIGFAWRAAGCLRELRQRQSFDVVHFLDAHFAYAYGGAYLASLFQSFRQRATGDRGLPYHSNLANLVGRLAYYNAARVWMECSAVQRAAHLLASSCATRDEFMAHYGVPPERVSVVRLGIDLDFFRPQPGQPLREQFGLGQSRVLLYVGYSTPRKGLEVLAEAMALLPPEVKLVIVGKWEAGYREKFWRSLRPQDRARVIEAGFVLDEALPAYYSMADLFVLPSRLEGFGLPIAEALACGTPVVATAGGSVPEVVGEGGLVVPLGDAHALAAAIARVLGDVDLYALLKEKGGRQVRDRFDRRRMVQDTLDLYRRYAP